LQVVIILTAFQKKEECFMTSLMNRPSLINEMISLPEAVSSLFENSFLSPGWVSNLDNNKLMTAFNVYEDSTSFYVMGLLPGLDPDKFDLNVKENMLTVSGKYTFNGWPLGGTQAETGKGKEEKAPAIQTLLREIPEGQFYRQIQLPSAFDADKIEAHYEDGLLKLRLPKTQSSQTRRIPVHSSKTQHIEGELVSGGKSK
jgi:HSP20 family protein